MRTLLVRRGITGFFESHDRAPRVELKAFQRDLLEAARVVGGEVLALQAADAANSYHHARLRLREDELVVVCHASFPIVAFTRSTPGDGPLRFVAMPVLADAFAASAYEVAGVDALAAPLDDDDRRVLGPADLAQVSYWRPETVGELIYNRFD